MMNSVDGSIGKFFLRTSKCYFWQIGYFMHINGQHVLIPVLTESLFHLVRNRGKISLGIKSPKSVLIIKTKKCNLISCKGILFCAGMCLVNVCVKSRRVPNKIVQPVPFEISLGTPTRNTCY